MCNLYRSLMAREAIAALFRARFPTATPNAPEEVYPGYPGLVVHECDGERVLGSITWGFPLVMTGKRGQPLKPKPVNNAREDKLGTAFWRDSFIRRRCLIPVSAWAEADGERGEMTRTWYSLPGGEPFAVAGIWRATDEWGDAYSMFMADGCEPMADTNDRMPVLLKESDWQRWLEASADEALLMCRTWDGELMIERTQEPWPKPRASAPAGPDALL